MRNLVKFQTTAAYEAVESNLILPNVSLTVDNNTVHYNPSTPPTPSYESVDLGLPSGTLWARYNVGAMSETECGLYFQWGDISGYTANQCGCNEDEKPFSWGDYKYNPSGDGETFTKYNSIDNKTVLDSSDDAATQIWGNDWHIPTSAQCQELIDNTTFEWTSINGVDGGKFTAQNGNYLFLPRCGGAENCMQPDSDYADAVYWSSTLAAEDYFSESCSLFAAYDGCQVGGYSGRYIGYPIRPVRSTNS